MYMTNIYQFSALGSSWCFLLSSLICLHFYPSDPSQPTSDNIHIVGPLKVQALIHNLQKFPIKGVCINLLVSDFPPLSISLLIMRIFALAKTLKYWNENRQSRSIILDLVCLTDLIHEDCLSERLELEDSEVLVNMDMSSSLDMESDIAWPLLGVLH